MSDVLSTMSGKLTAMKRPDLSVVRWSRAAGLIFITLSLLLIDSMLLAAQSNPISARVESELARLSLRQKVAQMFVFTFYGSPPNQPAVEFIREWQPGAVALLPSNLGEPAQIARLTNTLQQTSLDAGGLPLLVAVDQEGGIIAHLEDGFTRWPVPTLLTATADVDLAYRVGRAFASEMRAVGVNMNLAPVADLLTNPDNPIIGRRAFGADAAQVGPVVTAFADGLQAGGVLATAKHFPGHGDTDADSHVTLPVIMHDRQRLDAIELAPFRALIAADVAAIMVAHVVYTALDLEQRRPASLSPPIVSDLLRAQMGFEGLILPDALDMDAIDTAYSPVEAALASVLAGHDLILTGAHVSPQSQVDAIQAVIDAVQAGEIDEARIDASVRRILTAKARFDLLEWEPIDVMQGTQVATQSGGEALVSEMFSRGITVVHGGDRLPAPADSLLIYPASQPSLWRACDAAGQFVPLGVSDRPTSEEIAWAASAAERAPLVITFTRDVATNPAQRDLVERLPAEKTLVVALQSPFDIEVLPSTAAHLLTYSPLPAAYEPLCAILAGTQQALGQLVVDLALPSDSP